MFLFRRLVRGSTVCRSRTVFIWSIWSESDICVFIHQLSERGKLYLWGFLAILRIRCGWSNLELAVIALAQKPDYKYMLYSQFSKCFRLENMLKIDQSLFQFLGGSTGKCSLLVQRFQALPCTITFGGGGKHRG